VANDVVAHANDISVHQTPFFESLMGCDAATQAAKATTSASTGSIFTSANLVTMLFILIAGVFREL